jgi:hypothetical protein
LEDRKTTSAVIYRTQCVNCKQLLDQTTGIEDGTLNYA